MNKHESFFRYVCLMKAKLVYKSLLILINALACFFLGLIFIGSFSMSSEAANPLNDQEVLVRIIIYGIGISLFFSVVTFLLGIIFRKRMSFNWKYLRRLLLLQFLLLLIAYVAISLFVYFK